MKFYVFDGPVFNDFSANAVRMNNEFLRVSNQLDTLRQLGVDVQRFNLKEHAMAFIENETVVALMMKQGEEALPVTLFDDEVMSTGEYLSDDDFTRLILQLKEKKGI